MMSETFQHESLFFKGLDFDGVVILNNIAKQIESYPIIKPL